MQVFRTARLSAIKKKTIAIVGYGSQGRAQALNLRDNGLTPVIALPSRSKSRRRASADRFAVTPPAQATQTADILFILAPDHLHGEVFNRDIRPHLRSGQALVFAHASSVHFGLVTPPDDVDVILVAPLGPGKRLRELRGRKDGIPCFIAVHQNHSGKAQSLALALARGIGCLPAGAIPTTFADEAVGDLFGEQAVLCGGLGALLEAGVETLIKHGLPPHAAYLECVYQIDLIVDLIKSEGLKGMYERISPTAAYGARHAGRRVISAETRRAMDVLYREIKSGKFFAEWVRKGTANRRERYIPDVSDRLQRAEKTVLSKLKLSKKP